LIVGNRRRSPIERKLNFLFVLIRKNYEIK
jgi:hypothetical protein